MLINIDQHLSTVINVKLTFDFFPGLSHLFNTYCMNIYGSPLWKYHDKNLLEAFYIAWRKLLRRVWKISNVTHNNLLPFINNCHPIDVILERRYIKFVWSLYNSNYALYLKILRLSSQNGISTMGENVRYLMHKYDIVNSDWSQNINIVFCCYLGLFVIVFCVICHNDEEVQIYLLIHVVHFAQTFVVFSLFHY